MLNLQKRLWYLWFLDSSTSFLIGTTNSNRLNKIGEINEFMQIRSSSNIITWITLCNYWSHKVKIKPKVPQYHSWKQNCCVMPVSIWEGQSVHFQTILKVGLHKIQDFLILFKYNFKWPSIDGNMVLNILTANWELWL